MWQRQAKPADATHHKLRRDPPIDPLIIAAQADVDLSLLESTLRLSPGERLDACYRTVLDLDRFRHAAAKNR